MTDLTTADGPSNRWWGRPFGPGRSAQEIDPQIYDRRAPGDLTEM